MEESIENSLNFYFAGDTGYSKTFPLHRQIGDKLGPFDLSAIPIGAYKPRFFMKDSHCDPNEAVQIHSDIRSDRSVAIHWGTFPLANEHFDEPPAYLKKSVDEANNKNISAPIDFITIPHGESIHSRGTRINADEKRSANFMETIAV
jgi:N-acyl-phosphatidylethanolamine-hydrolysing phospholipase D